MTSKTSSQDLLDSLTLEEKITLLHQRAPGIERVGLAPFVTGAEALHGLSWLGEATTFPQPPGMAASWDPELLTEIGDAVSTEVRAKHAQDPTVSLNVWAPVVNTLRHPLWGRGEEGYSEDPDITATLATAYCMGLRGDDEKVWKTVPTLKHFCAYGNEVDRAVTDSHLPPQTLRETEFPAFSGPLQAGVVGAVMPGYNLVNGRPNHVSAEMLAELRSWAPHSIAIVSDAQAPSNLVDGERYYPDHIQATAAAIKAGLDSFTDNDARSEITVERVTKALEAGLLTEEDIDNAALHLLELRERTGQFEETDPYQIPASAIDLPEHRRLAREAAARGVVVLANDGAKAGEGLPLASPSVIAVVGPYADHLATDWYSGTPPYSVTIADAMRERYPDAEVRVTDGADVVALRAGDHLLAVRDGGEVVTASETNSDKLSTRFAVTRWGKDVVSLTSLGTGKLLTGADWIVKADADRIGGWVAQETFLEVRRGDGIALFHLGSGRWLRVQHGSHLLVTEADPALATVFEVEMLRSGTAAVQDACEGADVALVAVGNDPHIHGRETADRPGLALPAPMRAIWAAAVGTCPNSILTIVSSYPYAIGREMEEASAVIWSSHAGQELGHGIVDVISGDRIPTGRLPQTWWANEEDAGNILDYDVVNVGMTYRYNPARPLFGLGHGLGWSQVVYDSLTLSINKANAPAPTVKHRGAVYVDNADLNSGSLVQKNALAATVVVRNAGDREVDELVAIWSQAPDLPLPAPRTRLLAWTRVLIPAGEEAAVTLPIDLEQLAVWDVAAEDKDGRILELTPGAFRVQPGTYRIASGPSAADLPVGAELTVLGADRNTRNVVKDCLPLVGFDEYEGVVTSDRTRERGACIQVAHGKEAGYAQYDLLDATGAKSVRLSVAERKFPSSTPSEVSLEVRPAIRENGAVVAWKPLTPAVAVKTVDEDSSDAHYAWQDVTLDVAGEPLADGPVDLRITLRGAARVAEVCFLSGNE